MRGLYSFAIAFYATGVRIASIFNKKAKLICKGWHKWAQRVPWEKLNGHKVAWFHASSLGEFEQARPVMESFRADNPNYKILLTFFSPSGYEVRKNYNGAEIVCYLPPDSRRNAKKFITKSHPDIVFFVKYDYWFNYLNELQKNGRNTPVYLFSAILRPNQYFFKWYGRWFARQLQCYRHIFVQNDISLALLQSVGMTRCSIAGDTRFDRVNDIVKNAKTIAAVEMFIANGGDYIPKQNNVLMAGSSWPPDEQYIHSFTKSQKDIKVILAPHVIDESHLAQIEIIFGKTNCVRYSEICNSNSQEQNTRQVLIIDNIGMLSSLYRYATVACIGGGFGKGIHNTLEATVFGCPVCFGPNYQKFQEARDLISCGGARNYNNDQELSQILSEWLYNSESYNKASQACISYMQKNLGATSLILKQVENDLHIAEGGIV